MAPVSSLSGPTNEAVQAARIIEGVLGNAWASDPDGRFVYVTPSVLGALGTTLDEVNGVTADSAFGWKRVIHPDDYESAARLWRHCLSTGDEYDVEHRMLRAPGVYGWARNAGRPARDAGGRIVGWYGAVIDRMARSDLREPVDTSSTAGHESDLVASSLTFVHPDDRAAAEQAISRAFRNGVPQVISCRQRQPDGSYRLAEFRAEPAYRAAVPTQPMVQRPDEPWTVADELGETHDAVQAARVIEQLHGAAFAFDTAGRFTYASPIAQTSIAMTLEDLNRPLGSEAFLDGGDFGWKLGVHPEDYGAAAAHLRDCMRTGRPFDHDYRVLRATGDYVWHRFSIRPTRADDGRVTGWFGIGFEIDVYKRTEAALRDRERELQQLIDTVPALIWCTTPDGTPSYVNQRLMETVGVRLDDLTNPDAPRSLADVHPDDRQFVEQALAHAFKTGTVFAMQYRQKRVDGAYRWTDGRAEPMRDESGNIVQWYGVCVDVDDLVTAQQALQDRERELSQLVDMTPSHVWRLSPQGEPTFINKQLSDFLGLEVTNYDMQGSPRLSRAA